MSSSSSNSSKKEKDECSICLNAIDPRGGVPLTTPGCCGGRFHTACLQKLEDDSCPLCRQEFATNAVFRIPSDGKGKGSDGKESHGRGDGSESSCCSSSAGDTAKLNDNNIISICEDCPKGTQTPAVKFCIDCSMPVCTACGEKHSASIRGSSHEYISIAESRKLVTRKCHIHRTKPIEYVCETCDVSLCCQKCIIVGHPQGKDHKILPLEDYAAQQREKIRASCLQSEGLLNLQKDILTDVHARVGVHRANCESSRALLDNFFDRLLEIIVSCRKTWQDELEAQGSETDKLLSADKKSIELNIGSGELSIGRAKDMLSFLSDIELIDQCGNLVELLGALDKGLMAPFTVTETSAAKYDGNIVSDLLLSVTRCLEGNPFQLPSSKSLPFTAEQVEEGGLEEERRRRRRRRMGGGRMIRRKKKEDEEKEEEEKKRRMQIRRRKEKEEEEEQEEQEEEEEEERGGDCGLLNEFYSSLFSSLSSSSVRFTSSFSEPITLRRKPGVALFGAKKGVLRGAIIQGICLLTKSAVVDIVGGGGSGVVSAQNSITETDSILFVCDCDNKRIQAMNAYSGALISTIGGADQLENPYGICLNSSINTPELFVADRGNHIVQVFDTRTGTLLRTYGTTSQAGSSTNQFNRPTAVCIGSMTTRAAANDPLCLFVSEYNNHRIQVMNASTGAFIKTIGGGQGSGPGQLNKPVGACLLPDTSNPGSGSLLFVVNTGNHRVSVFNVLTGAFVRTIGSGQGSDPGQLNRPYGIYVLPARASAANSSSDPMIFVADQSNNRVSIFNATSGAYVRSIDVGHITRYVLPAISSDGEAFMYVSTNGGRVKIWPL